MHSEREVGFEYGKMIGRSLISAIASITSRVNSFGTVLTPMMAVGLSAFTASTRTAGLASATYQVGVTWLGYSTIIASNAKFKVYDGVTLLGTVSVDQRNAPWGPASGGSFFQALGNFAVASGLKLTDALKQENMTTPYVNVVAVKRSNADSAFAKDIVKAYQSPEFQQTFKSNPAWAGYRLPDYFAK